MREVKIGQLCQRLMKQPSGPLLGLDVGTRCIGVAVSDEKYRIANPHSFLEKNSGSLHCVILKLEKVVKHLSVPALVIGYPLRISGFQSMQTPMVETFVRELETSEKFNDLSFVYWDERLTTKAVESAMSFYRMDYRQKKRLLDKLAAMSILQNCLDNMARNQNYHQLAAAQESVQQSCTTIL